jgi:predicted amidohydrolase YtcJ
MRGVSTTSVAADLIMLNANVLTIDPARPRAQAVAIGGGRFLAVGSNDDVRGWVNPGVLVRDLAGQTLLPGFYDSHNHMLLTGLHLAAVDLSGATWVADVVRVMGERAADGPLGKWVLSSARWHESQLAEGRFPLREELDRVYAGQPMLLQGVATMWSPIAVRSRWQASGQTFRTRQAARSSGPPTSHR